MFKNLPKTLVIIGCICLFAAAVYFDSVHTNGPSAAPVTVAEKTSSERVPDVQLTPLNGKAFNLYAYKGKQVFINFWAAWCAPCIIEMPEILKLAAENRHVQVLLISVDETPEGIPAFFAKLGLADAAQSENVQIITDPQQEVAQHFQSFKYPESYVLSPDMELRKKFVGTVTAEEVQQFLR